jgi:transketolase
MRQKVCETLIARAENPNMVFLTGDLGFMALEPLRDKMGDRFINCGVAEQNMVSVAAAMAKEKFEVWIYTIAPFCYARAFEQIRNDVCMHKLPVKMLCNGGGYGYGVMGATHHAIEDYGVLLTLPEMRVFVPAFAEDISDVITLAATSAQPCYIRLGRDERWPDFVAPTYAPWRRVIAGDGPVVITLGPLAGSVRAALNDLGVISPDLWLVAELPVTAEQMPPQLAERIAKSERLCVIEEHVGHGGLGSMMCRWTVEAGIRLKAFQHLHAFGYPSGLAGSQDYLRRENGLGKDDIRTALNKLSQA